MNSEFQLASPASLFWWAIVPGSPLRIDFSTLGIKHPAMCHHCLSLCSPENVLSSPLLRIPHCPTFVSCEDAGNNRRMSTLTDTLRYNMKGNKGTRHGRVLGSSRHTRPSCDDQRWQPNTAAEAARPGLRSLQTTSPSSLTTRLLIADFCKDVGNTRLLPQASGSLRGLQQSQLRRGGEKAVRASRNLR